MIQQFAFVYINTIFISMTYSYCNNLWHFITNNFDNSIYVDLFLPNTITVMTEFFTKHTSTYIIQRSTTKYLLS